MRRFALITVLAAAAIALAAGCNDGTNFGFGVGDAAKTASSNVTSDGGTCAAASTMTALDPATLPACAPT